MSIDQSHPPHTAARRKLGGLLGGVVAVSLAVGVGVPTLAGASPSTAHGRNARAGRWIAGFDAAVTPRVGNDAVRSFVTQSVRSTAARMVAYGQAIDRARVVAYVTALVQAQQAQAAAQQAAQQGAEAGQSSSNWGYSTASTRSSSSGSTGAAASGSVGTTLACIRQEESGGNYGAVNGGSGAGGAYQFMPSTWQSLGGSGLPENASPAEQDAIAMRAYQSEGWSPWRGDSCV